VANYAYWTEPGEYYLSINFITGISPAPKGAPPGPGGFGRVNIVSNVVKLKVEAK
jgi:hypothetical protein